jgi:hypothetical protein
VSDDNGFGRADNEPELSQPSPFAAFTTDGLKGLLDAIDSGSSVELVDDPDALRRAEDAVAGRSTPAPAGRGPGAAPIDGAWAVVAAQVTPGDTAGLEDVARALEADGIDFGWDPYDPHEAVNFGPPVTGSSSQKIFNVMVPASQIGRAQGALGSEPPQGVSYAWPGSTSSAGGSGSVGTGSEFDFEPADQPKATATRDGIQLSDNERFAHMAGGIGKVGEPAPAGRPGLSALGRALLVAALIGIVLSIVMVLTQRG